jgi:hypothetical protein
MYGRDCLIPVFAKRAPKHELFTLRREWCQLKELCKLAQQKHHLVREGRGGNDMLNFRLLNPVAVCLLVALPALAQQTSPSVPAVPVEVPSVPLANIPDLNQTPPVALMAMIRLIRLGVYPLDEDLSADPNRPTSESDLAFMLINLFMPGTAGEWPVDQQTALAQLSVQSQGAVSESGAVIITGVTFLPLLYGVLDLTPEQEAALRAQLIEALPAWQLGNFDAPLTRAATAILLSATLDFLEEHQPQG